MLNKLSLFNAVKIKASRINALPLASQSSRLVCYLPYFIQWFKLKQNPGFAFVLPYTTSNYQKQKAI